jgi:hypothetical protein
MKGYTSEKFNVKDTTADQKSVMSGQVLQA